MMEKHDRVGVVLLVVAFVAAVTFWALATVTPP